MSCKHGNWEPCEECEAEDAIYQSGFHAGIKSITKELQEKGSAVEAFLQQELDNARAIEAEVLQAQEPVRAVEVMISAVGSTHMTPAKDYYTAPQPPALCPQCASNTILARDHYASLAKVNRLENKIGALQAKVAEQACEVAQWKNNHATVVRQARVLKERTDMPLERVKAYEHYGEMIERVAELEALNVTKIRLDIVPGDDGMGEEVYARSVADVEQKLSEIDEHNGELTSKVAELEQKAKTFRQLLTDLVEYVETPPDRNCSCHISPPCSDCVDNSHLRGLLEGIKTAVAVPKPFPQATDLRDSYQQVDDFSAGNYKGV